MSGRPRSGAAARRRIASASPHGSRDRRNRPAASAPAAIALTAGEHAVWTESVEWHELRADPAAPFAGPQLTFQDRGVLHVTTRRLVFDGRRMLASIQVHDVTGGVRYPDALCVHRRLDRDVFLILEDVERVELLATVLAQVVAWPEPTVVAHPALPARTRGRPS